MAWRDFEDFRRTISNIDDIAHDIDMIGRGEDGRPWIQGDWLDDPGSAGLAAEAVALEMKLRAWLEAKKAAFDPNSTGP